MALSANKLKTVRQRRFYPWPELLGWVPPAAAAANLTAISDVATLIQHVTTTNLAGVVFNATTDDMTGFIWRDTAWDCDHPLRFRMVFTNGSDVAGNITWILLYGAAALNADLTSAPATALNTPVPNYALPDANASRLRLSGYGIINGGVLTESMLGLCIAISATTNTLVGAGGDTPAAAGATLFGIEVEYSPKWYKGRKGPSPAWQGRQP